MPQRSITITIREPINFIFQTCRHITIIETKANKSRRSQIALEIAQSRRRRKNACMYHVVWTINGQRSFVVLHFDNVPARTRTRSLSLIYLIKLSISVKTLSEQTTATIWLKWVDLIKVKVVGKFGVYFEILFFTANSSKENIHRKIGHITCWTVCKDGEPSVEYLAK